jgi:hypothetical protein
VNEREPDPELGELISEAFAEDERALLTRQAALPTDAGSPEHQPAEQDRDVSTNAWRKVVARSEQLRKAAHTSVSQDGVAADTPTDEEPAT